MKASNGLMRPHHDKLIFSLRLLDIALIVVTLFALANWYGVQWTNMYDSAAITAVALWTFFSIGQDLYRAGRVEPIIQRMFNLFSTWALVITGLLLLAFALKHTSDFSRVVIGVWFVSTPLLMLLVRIFIRLVARELRQRGYNARTVAVVGATAQGLQLKQDIDNAAWMGLNFVGFFDDRSAEDRVARLTADLSKGNLKKLVEQARAGNIDLIYIALPLKAEDRIKFVIDSLRDTTVSLYFVPDFAAFDMLHGRWTSVGQQPALSVHESPYNGVEDWFKRAEDILLSLGILTLVSIPMLVIAGLIKLTSRGPVIFKQKRYGINGEEIYVWKFRTMTVMENADVVTQASRTDSRITPLGSFLRRTSLDELPQFINVLQGRMSVVGPRPHAVSHNELYRKQISGYMLRHKVKPGITGWAQINGWRGETDTLDKMAKRIEFDLEYIRNWSLTLDLKIFFLTVFKGFVHKNAY